MVEWAMAHPYLTFILVLYGFCVIGSVIGSMVEAICDAIKGSKNSKEEQNEDS